MQFNESWLSRKVYASVYRWNLEEIGKFISRYQWTLMCIVYALEMSFSGKWQTETKPIPMKWQTQKPNTKPILFWRKIPIINQILRRPYSRYRWNTKTIPRNVGQKYQIPIWYWYFLGIPNFWLPIDITSMHLLVSCAKQTPGNSNNCVCLFEKHDLVHAIGGELYESVGVEAPICCHTPTTFNGTPMEDHQHGVRGAPWVFHSFLWVCDSKMGASTPTLSYNSPPMVHAFLPNYLRFTVPSTKLTLSLSSRA